MTTSAGTTPALIEEIEPTVRHALAAVVELFEAPETEIHDRAAAYAALAGLKRWLHRHLVRSRGQTEIITYMEANGVQRLGPLTLKATAVGVKWPANDPANWTDSTIQDFMAELAANPLFSEFIRHVPEHYEIATAELGAAVHLADANALELHRFLKLRGWRTEEHRNLSLELRA